MPPSNSPERIERAENDWRTIQAVLALEDPPYEVAAFHAQQAAEKYLKAFLLGHGWQLRKTHDLVDLLTDCLKYDAGLQSLTPACQELNPFVLSGRYPIAAVTRSACERATRAAEAIRNELRKRLT
jgi:HEPN domain-containing protein